MKNFTSLTDIVRNGIKVSPENITAYILRGDKIGIICGKDQNGNVLVKGYSGYTSKHNTNTIFLKH